MARLTLGLAIFASWLLLLGSPASAYVWRCHTPNGDVWTAQPPQSGDCEEYDGTFNPSPAPQTAPPVQYSEPQYVPPAPPAPPPTVYAPAPPAPVYAYPYPAPYPVPYPYYPYPAYPRYYGGAGLYLGIPPLLFDFRFGGHGGHFRGGHRWR